VSLKKALDEPLATLPDDQMRVVLDFARFLHARQEQEDWQRFGVRQLARAYGPNEPEYTSPLVVCTKRP
jgi:hypothetical protein